MTIYKPNNPEKKQEKAPTVAPDVVMGDKEHLMGVNSGNDVLIFYRRRPVTNLDVLRRRQRIRCAVILLLMLLVVAMALVLALLFNSRIISSVYIGESSVLYHENLPGEAGNLKGGTQGSFVESYEVDTRHGSYEKLEVPPVLDFRRSTVLHDFDMNLTAIVDRAHSRCFIMPLNRTTVQPPKDLLDMLEKLKSGYFLPDVKIIREAYKVVLPPVDDIEQFGFYIWSDCQFYSTYRLVKAPEGPIVASKKKRSAECSMLGDGFCLGSTFTDSMTCLSFSDCTM